MKISAVEYFNFIRDIPYRLPLQWGEADHSCNGKHIMLYHLLSEIGVPVRPRVCEERWSDFTELPKRIKKISHDDKAYHVYLETKLKGKWCALDATWDRELEGVFQINQWDGKSETEIAADPYKTCSVKKSLEIFNERLTKKEFNEDIRVNGKFYKEYNDWLQNIRNKNNKV